MVITEMERASLGMNDHRGVRVLVPGRGVMVCRTRKKTLKWEMGRKMLGYWSRFSTASCAASQRRSVVNLESGGRPLERMILSKVG